MIGNEMGKEHSKRGRERQRPLKADPSPNKCTWEENVGMRRWVDEWALTRNP